MVPASIQALPQLIQWGLVINVFALFLVVIVYFCSTRMGSSDVESDGDSSDNEDEKDVKKFNQEKRPSPIFDAVEASVDQ